MKLSLQLAVVLLALIFGAPSALAQASRSRASGALSRPGAAQGELTVTLTVVPSVGVVMDENGQPKIILANAPDPADNVSALRLSPATEHKKTKTKK